MRQMRLNFLGRKCQNVRLRKCKLHAWAKKSAHICNCCPQVTKVFITELCMSLLTSWPNEKIVKTFWALCCAPTRDGRHFDNKEQSSSNPKILACASTWHAEPWEQHQANLAGMPCFAVQSTRENKKETKKKARRYAIRVGNEDSTCSAG